METSRLTIQVSNILQGGKTCSNPSISVHLISGLAMPCPVVDGKIEVQLDGLEGQSCFDLVIDCEDCNTCPPQVKRICLCDDNSQCSDCETCINGICTPICPEDEFCDNGICKDCLVDGDCLCNKECINGSCTCPPDKPHEYNGCCYECEEGDTDGCQVCTGGRFVPKDCGAYQLNPETCACEECLDSGDCTEPNTCCVSGQCECCPGYYFDPLSSSCLPIPDCQGAEDCPDCFTCVNGTCQEVTCPAGYVRTGIAGSCCVKECDCDNPSCPEGGSCVEYENGSCYCKPCSGSCNSNNDCGVGCGCYDGQCKPKPKGCEGPCYNASDCGFGCGCLDGECVDCKTLGCNNNDDCLRAEGCDCINGNCDKSDCDSPCIDADDCDNGCGCKDNDCVKCTNFPCVTDANCPEGCNCVNGLCNPNPCERVYCITPGDCGEGCGCDEGRCKPCSSLSCASGKCDETPGCLCNGSICQDDPNDDDCDDDLRIEKRPNCVIRGALDLDNCCDCPTIGLHVDATFAGTNLTVLGRLRKGLAGSDPLLSATGIANELPLGGVVKFVVKQEEAEVDNGGAPTGITRVTTMSNNENYTGVDSNTHVFTITPIGNTYSDAGKVWKVIHICVSVEHVSTFTFENECEYKTPNIVVKCDSNGSGVVELTKLTRCKTPLFTWSESTDGITYSVFRKVYSDRVDSNSYKDDIGYPEGVEACKYYKLETDCGCDRTTYYSCNGDDTPATKLVFCTPTDITVTPSNCNLDIDIDEVQLCLAMIGVDYKLYLNGVLEGTYTVNGSGILFAGGLTINHTEPVRTVKLEIECDDCDDCTIEKDIPLVEDPCGCSGSVLNVTVDSTNACTTGITYTITGGTANYVATLKKGATTIFTTTHNATGVKSYNSTLTNGTYTMSVTDAFGCVKTYGFIVNTCCQVTVTGLAYDCATKEVTGTVVDLNGSGTYILEVGIQPSVNIASGAFSEVIDLLDGSYYVKVTDSVNGGCFWEGNLNVACGGIEADITFECDSTDPTRSCIRVENPSGGTAPYIVSIYAAPTAVTVDANGCPTNAGQLRYSNTYTVPVINCSATYGPTWEALVKITDALGRTKCFHPDFFLDCATNAFSFDTRMYCDSSTKKICFKPNKTGNYTLTINAVNIGTDSFTAGQEKCYTTALAAGTYAVTMTNSFGVTITKNVIVTECSSYSVSYDCDLGLVVLENGLPWTGNIKVDGAPSSGYYSYTGTSTIYLADTTPNHSVSLYSGTTLLYSTIVSSIDCCNLNLANLTFTCDPITADGRIVFDIVNTVRPAATHTILIKQGDTTIHSYNGYASTSFTSDIVANGTYTIEVTDEEYNVPNAGIGANNSCTVIRSVAVDCSAICDIDDVSALYKGEIDCVDNAQSNTWRVKAYNNESFTVNYQVYRKPNTLVAACNAYDVSECDLSGFNLVGSGSIAAFGSGCVTFATGGDSTACFVVKFSDPNDSSCYKCVKATFEG